MPVVYSEISFTIYDSYSLKDKRSTVKSIIQRMQKKYNISIAEIEQLEIQNAATIGIAAVSNSALQAKKVIDKVIRQIEEEYEVDIYDIFFE